MTELEQTFENVCVVLNNCRDEFRRLLSGMVADKVGVNSARSVSA